MRTTPTGASGGTFSRLADEEKTRGEIGARASFAKEATARGRDDEETKRNRRDGQVTEGRADTKTRAMETGRCVAGWRAETPGRMETRRPVGVSQRKLLRTPWRSFAFEARSAEKQPEKQEEKQQQLRLDFEEDEGEDDFDDDDAFDFDVVSDEDGGDDDSDLIIRNAEFRRE